MSKPFGAFCNVAGPVPPVPSPDEYRGQKTMEDMQAAVRDRGRVYRISGILQKKGGETMTKEKTIIKVRRGINGFKYSACDAQGNFLGNFAKLADIRRHWLREIKWGQIVIIRELDKMPDMSRIEATKATIENILRAYAKK